MVLYFGQFILVTLSRCQLDIRYCLGHVDVMCFNKVVYILNDSKVTIDGLCYAFSLDFMFLDAISSNDAAGTFAVFMIDFVWLAFELPWLLPSLLFFPQFSLPPTRQCKDVMYSYCGGLYIGLYSPSSLHVEFVTCMQDQK